MEPLSKTQYIFTTQASPTISLSSSASILFFSILQPFRTWFFYLNVPYFTRNSHTTPLLKKFPILPPNTLPLGQAAGHNGPHSRWCHCQRRHLTWHGASQSGATCTHCARVSPVPCMPDGTAFILLFFSFLILYFCFYSTINSFYKYHTLYFHFSFTNFIFFHLSIFFTLYLFYHKWQ
jgi:hypothetical protein